MYGGNAYAKRRNYMHKMATYAKHPHTYVTENSCICNQYFLFVFLIWGDSTVTPSSLIQRQYGRSRRGGGSVQGRWGAGEGMVGAGEGRVSTAIWLFAVWLLSQLFWRHFWLRDERPPCSRAWLCHEGMMIAVGTRNMVTNPLSWSSKSAVEPAAKIKGLNPGPHWNSNP